MIDDDHPDRSTAETPWLFDALEKMFDAVASSWPMSVLADILGVGRPK